MAEQYSTEKFRFYLLDLGWGNLETLKALPHCLGCINDAVELKTFDLKELLQCYLNIDLSGPKPMATGSQTPTVVLAIDGMGAFQKGLADSGATKNREFIQSLLRVKNARFHLIAAGAPAEFSGGATTNPIGETLRNFQSGVWLGDGTVVDASSFNFQFLQGEVLKNLPKGSAFWVNRNKYTPIKLATCHVGDPAMDEWIIKLASLS